MNIVWQKNLCDHQNSKICNPGGKPTYAVSNSFSELAYFSPIHQKFCSHFLFLFWIFFATFTFLLTWQNILRNLKNGIESTFLPYYYHSSPIVLVIWHILKFWKKSWNDTKDFEIFKCKSLSSTMPPIKNEKNKILKGPYNYTNHI